MFSFRRTHPPDEPIAPPAEQALSQDPPLSNVPGGGFPVRMVE